MTIDIVMVGAGGFGREALDVLESINQQSEGPVFGLLGVVDSSPHERNLARLVARGITYLGTEDEWFEQRKPIHYVVGIGNPAARRRVDERLRAAGHIAATLVHPQAVIGSMVEVGQGTVVCGGVHVSTNVTLGRQVHLNPNATIGHDSVLGNFVSVNPGAIVSGDVVLADEVLVGAGATILQGLKVGESSIVGASACVVRDVERSTTVKGVPAQ